MCDGTFVVESALWDHGDIVSMQRQDTQILEAGECKVLDTLQLVVAYNQCSQTAQIGKDVWRQDCNVVITQIPVMKKSNLNSICEMIHY